MNRDWHEQIQRYASGQASAEEIARLEAALNEDAELRACYVDYMNLDVALSAAADSASMTRTLAVRRFPRVWMAAAAVFLLGFFLWPRPVPMARLEAVHGEVAVVGKQARAGQSLISGNGLRLTGEESAAAMVFADGTRLEFAGDTVVTRVTESPEQGKRLELSEGFLTAQVAKQPAGRPLILATPQSEAVVLGTVFRLSSGAAVTFLETEEGKVRLRGNSDGRSIEVPAGFEGVAVDGAVLEARQSPPRYRQPRFTTDGYHRTTALSPDGRTLVTTAYDFDLVTLWDAASGTERLRIGTHVHQVVATAFSPDGEFLACAGFDGKISIWRVANGRVARLVDGPDQVKALTFSNAGTSLVMLAGPSQGSKRLVTWNWSTGELQTNPHSFTGETWGFSPSGKRMAISSTATSAVTIWDTASGQLLATFPDFPGRVLCLAISPDDATLAVSDMTGRVALWDIADGQMRHSFRPAGQTVQGLAFSPDGRRLAMGQRHATVRIWDVASGQQQAVLEGPITPGRTATVRLMFFSPDGKTLATTESQDASTVRLWNLPDL